jgi:hypothetical protein
MRRRLPEMRRKLPPDGRMKTALPGDPSRFRSSGLQAARLPNFLRERLSDLGLNIGMQRSRRLEVWEHCRTRVVVMTGD